MRRARCCFIAWYCALRSFPAWTFVVLLCVCSVSSRSHVEFCASTCYMTSRNIATVTETHQAVCITPGSSDSTICLFEISLCRTGTVRNTISHIITLRQLEYYDGTLRISDVSCFCLRIDAWKPQQSLLLRYTACTFVALHRDVANVHRGGPRVHQGRWLRQAHATKATTPSQDNHFGR